MNTSKLSIAYKTPSVILKVKNSTGARTLTMLLHFLAGIALAAFLVPEGVGIALGSLCFVVVAKAVYDYVDGGAIKFESIVALAAGGVLSLIIAQFMGW
ncbi:hypothetical protein EKL30_11505 [Candidimonas sp. SYP-B2681]|uniref:hypothetical protein n=1 Tax=Candidimonas sp. SYP-B2681 TaxID=2497686 RepID=UPI000F8843B2|nr:hypothetical protein [Candidimonas sp. SYP-B2681]RTZ42343.1 hypothetical protein EKL30_11505 [Candidimonas sp. SYP-B2681]